jgi:hypothetical protein
MFLFGRCLRPGLFAHTAQALFTACTEAPDWPVSAAIPNAELRRAPRLTRLRFAGRLSLRLRRKEGKHYYFFNDSDGFETHRYCLCTLPMAIVHYRTTFKAAVAQFMPSIAAEMMPPA